MSIKYDAEKINEFNEDLEGTIDRYRTNAAYFTLSCEKYGANSTHVGKAAEASKQFMMTKQMQFMLDVVKIQKKMAQKYFDAENYFKEKVDASQSARLDTDVLRKENDYFQIQKDLLENQSFAIEYKAREVVEKFGEFNRNAIPPNYGKARRGYEELCGGGGFIDDCIRKFEEYDDIVLDNINQSEIQGDIADLITRIQNTMNALSLMQVQAQPMDIQTFMIAVVGLGRAFAETVFQNAKESYNNYQLIKPIPRTNFSKIYPNSFTVVDANRVRIGTVSDSFVEINYVDGSGKNVTSYGGDQSWFRDGPFHGNAIDLNGCGIIAAVNQYLYLTGQTQISQADYKKMVHGFLKAKDQLTPAREKISLGRIAAIYGPTGALPTQMTDYVDNMCADKGMKVFSNWDYFQDYEHDYESIKKQLNNGVPVIWAMHDFENAFKNDTSKLGVSFYSYDSSNGTYTKSGAEASSHYVVITAIYEEKDTAGTSRRMLEISSWGKKYYVDYDQYIDFVSDNPHNKPFSSITNTSK